MDVFEGYAENIEDNRNKVQDLTEADHGQKGETLYPSANAVWFLYQPLDERVFTLGEKVKANTEHIGYALEMGQNAVNAVSGAYEGIEKINNKFTKEVDPFREIATEQLEQLTATKLNIEDVDDSLSETSENPVQNKVITKALADNLQIANTYTDEVANLNKSQAVHDANSYTDEKVNAAKADMGATMNLSFANAIKGKESGYAVALTDISPIEHNVKVKVKRKNLLPYPYAAIVSANGITWTDNGDGTVSAVGTTTGYSQFWLTETNFFESGKSYVWTTYSPIELILLYNDSNGEAKTAASGIIWQDTYTFKRMYLQVPKDRTADNTAFPIVVEGTVIDNYWEPYIADLTQVNVEVFGKNVLPPVSWGTYQKNGLNFECREDGGIVVNGTSTAAVVINFPKLTLKHGTSYAISLNHNREGITGNSGLFLTYTNPEGTTVRLKGSHAGRETVLWKKEYTLSSVGLQIDANKTLNNFVFYPQIEIGETITDYEPYVEPVQYTPNADGTVDGVASTNSSMTLQIDTDGATVEAEYIVDTKKYIDKKFAELQALILEV